MPRPVVLLHNFVGKIDIIGCKLCTLGLINWQLKVVIGRYLDQLKITLALVKICHFLVQFGHILVAFWSHFGHILVTFWSHFGHILVTFWSHFGHNLPKKFCQTFYIWALYENQKKPLKRYRYFLLFSTYSVFNLKLDKVNVMLIIQFRII